MIPKTTGNFSTKLIVDISQIHKGAFDNESVGNRLPNASGGSCYDCDFVI
jgi:hypothetical protein